LKKGSLAGVDGRVQSRHYEGQDGKRVYVTEVVAESVQFLEPKNQTNQQSSNSNSQGQQQNNYTSVDEDPFVNNGKPIDISDGELPF
jgi:single-strand DNA-binding protein